MEGEGNGKERKNDISRVHVIFGNIFGKWRVYYGRLIEEKTKNEDILCSYESSFKTSVGVLTKTI